MRYKTITIPKNKHRARPLQLGLNIGSRSLFRSVVFDTSCKYDIGQDQSDWNKLFGIGFIPAWKFLLVFVSWLSFGVLFKNLHHKNSARFVWRYNNLNGMIEIGCYVYNNGVRVSEKLMSVPLNRAFKIAIHVNKGTCDFFCFNENNVLQVVKEIPVKTGFISYNLGGYFGGNRKAPHTIIYSIKNL